MPRIISWKLRTFVDPKIDDRPLPSWGGSLHVPLSLPASMRAVCVTVVVLFACICVAADFVTIDGTIETNCGSGNEAVPMEHIRLTNVSSSQYYSQVTDSKGYFAFEGIEAGAQVELSVIRSPEFMYADPVELIASNVTISFELTPLLSLTAPPDVQIECDLSVSPINTGFPEVTCFCPTELGYADNTESSECNLAVTRLWTVIASFGLSTDRVQLITVVDTVDPVVTAPPGITVECDSDTSPATTGEATASDACSPTTIGFWDATFSGCPAEDNRTWIATDICGNSGSAVQKIFVADNTAPEFIVSPMPFNGTCGDASQEWYQSFAFSVVEDSCSSASVHMELDGSCSGTASVTAEDECGNVSTQSTTFTTQALNPNDPNNCGTCWVG